MPESSNSVFDNGKAGGPSPSYSDVLFNNERAMWWAEFDGIGEEAVRGNVERNSYPSTGMEVARQWLALRERPQRGKGVQSNESPAEKAAVIAPDTPSSAAEELTLASRIDANSRAIAEIAANARKSARTMVLIGAIASLLAICAIVMVLAHSRQGAPVTKEASAQSFRQKQVPQPVAPALLPTEQKPQAPATPPNDVREAPSPAPQIKPLVRDLEGQSLANVLAMIADKVGGEGTIDFTAQFHDLGTNGDQTQQLSYRISNVTIDPNRCRIGFHWHVGQDGRLVSDQDRTVDLRLAKNISVGSIDVEPGGRFSLRSYPKVYVAHVARWDSSSGDDFYFHSRGMAERVGSAMRHAIELCNNREKQFSMGSHEADNFRRLNPGR